MSSGDAEEPMVVGEVDVIPTGFRGRMTTDVGIEGVVDAIMPVDIGILSIDSEGDVEVIVGEADRRSDSIWELMAYSFFEDKLTPVEGVDAHVPTQFGQYQPLMVVGYGPCEALMTVDGDGLEELEFPT